MTSHGGNISDSAEIGPDWLSPLEFFHPNGQIAHAKVIGGNCPKHLIPSSTGKTNGLADLILFAPTKGECLRTGWLEEAAETINQRLAQDGFLYALVPQRWRSRTQQLLIKQNLQVTSFILHLPDWVSSRYFIPLKMIPAQYAFVNLFPTRAFRRNLALTLLRLPGGSNFLGSLLPYTSFVVQREGSRMLFNWLFELAEMMKEPQAAVVSTSWRNKNGSIVIHCFSGSSNPVLVAKSTLKKVGFFEKADEFSTIRQLGEHARQAGAQIPEPIFKSQIGGYPLFLQTALRGRTIASIIAGHPNQIPRMLERIVVWLEAWNLSTRRQRNLDRHLLERKLFVPLNSLAPRIPDLSEYIDWLESHHSRPDSPVPFVAAHNDLTMWNILLDSNNRLGIVDWGEAVSESLPLTDYFYATLDAVSVANGFDRERALQECFTDGGTYFGLVKRFMKRLQGSLKLSDAFVTLCLHACFIHHAVNEQISINPGGPQSFFTILQRLVKDRITLNEVEI